MLSLLRNISSWSILSISLATTFILVGCGANDPSTPHQTLEAESIPRVDWKPSQGKTKIRINSKANPMDLVLYENRTLIADDAVLLRDGVKVPFSKSGLKRPLTGHVVGDPSSRVGLVQTANGLQGLVLSKGQVYELKNDASSVKKQSFGKADDEELAALGRGDGHVCGNDHDEDEHDAKEGEVHTHSAKGVHKTNADNKCFEAGIALVADYTMVQRAGGTKQAEEAMLQLLNTVDVIYRKQLKVRFSVKALHTFSEEGGPAFNHPNIGSSPVTQFQKYKASKLPDMPLAHLITDRGHGAYVIGRAVLGGICGRSQGVGVSNYFGQIRPSTLVLAHELGHNFGANHDPGHQSPFIMSKAAYGFATEFSPKSVGEMKRRMSRASCLVPVPCEGDGPKSPAKPEQPAKPPVKPKQPPVQPKPPAKTKLMDLGWEFTSLSKGKQTVSFTKRSSSEPLPKNARAVLVRVANFGNAKARSRVTVSTSSNPRLCVLDLVETNFGSGHKDCRVKVSEASSIQVTYENTHKVFGSVLTKYLADVPVK